MEGNIRVLFWLNLILALILFIIGIVFVILIFTVSGSNSNKLTSLIIPFITLIIPGVIFAINAWGFNKQLNPPDPHLGKPNKGIDYGIH